MSPADAVLADALHEAGFEHLTPWHLRCVEAYLAQLATMRTVSWQDRYDLLSERLGYDLNNTPMQLHAMALRDDGASGSPSNASRLRADDEAVIMARINALRRAMEFEP